MLQMGDGFVCLYVKLNPITTKNTKHLTRMDKPIGGRFCSLCSRKWKSVYALSSDHLIYF